MRDVHPLILILGIGAGLLALLSAVAAMPLVFLAVAGGVWWVRNHHAPSLPWRAFLTRKPAILTAALAAGGMGAQWIFQGIVLLADAAFSAGLLHVAGGGLLSLIAAVLVSKILKGEIMHDIFSLAGDPAALEAFCDNAPTPEQTGAGTFEPACGLEDARAAVRERVIGQDAIVDEALALIFRRAQLKRPNKPVAVLMFAGATGAGKTELAKAFADTLADGRFIRIDGNEMTEAQSTQRLIGSPPGYVGSENGGWLCREIGRLKTGVLLIDEVEKAHPDVYKLLMGLMDEARLTEQSTGQTYSAQGFLIVLTTNAEHQQIAQIVHDVADPQDRAAQVKDALRSVFKPEQLARMDDIFSFSPLDRRSVVQIIGKFLFSFAQDVGVEIKKVDTGLLVDLVTRREKLADYGIREVVRLVERAVVDGMLEARAAGASQVEIRLEGDQVRVVPAAQATTPQTATA